MRERRRFFILGVRINISLTPLLSVVHSHRVSTKSSICWFAQPTTAHHKCTFHVTERTEGEELGYLSSLDCRSHLGSISGQSSQNNSISSMELLGEVCWMNAMSWVLHTSLLVGISVGFCMMKPIKQYNRP